MANPSPALQALFSEAGSYYLCPMPLRFNSLLLGAGLALEEVRLVRHQDSSSLRGRSLFRLWQEDRESFEVYQSLQSPKKRSHFNGGAHWAVFVGTPDHRTMFVGLYSAELIGPLEAMLIDPSTGRKLAPGSCDRYQLTIDDQLGEFEGKLFIDWGDGHRSWLQRPHLQDKVISELRTTFQDPPFPGFNSFIKALSDLEGLPIGWREPLRATRGVYLLTCPKTKEQYVGSAMGADGFMGRWQSYLATGHGGNVALKGRAPSDYQVSILEVASSTATQEDILAMESLWKIKLQSREMGLNRN